VHESVCRSIGASGSSGSRLQIFVFSRSSAHPDYQLMIFEKSDDPGGGGFFHSQDPDKTFRHD
jgi:hypothetical protein